MTQPCISMVIGKTIMSKNSYTLVGDKIGQIIPYPTEWYTYKPLPKMEGKQLGITSHLFVKEGMEKMAGDSFKKVIDIVIKESTCVVLKAEQSLNEPTHFILYEEWLDYDEFFSVQLKREYRKDISKWLGPLAARPAGPEFFEVYHDATNPKPKMEISLNEEMFAVISSSHIDNLDKEIFIRDAFTKLTDELAKEPSNSKLNAQQSINNSKHFIIYQEWTDYDYFINVEMKKINREYFSKTIAKPGACDNNQDKKLFSKTEFFKIIYDPGRF